ncbi:hypothetical protein HBI56_153880 [Parastagonospora nodorum]|nr:hypothetical protein HBH56_116540 [Parastagonospora nodorum]KAH3928911.1 hypothetical protein HBH54_132620 [Parastagonospora nodorum]KAH3950737.1 hypothetical protein HBH53_072880 [Parastagonospora nodorum]KAH3965809.1 hypothetical protein HBH51_148840 [Parastagonospora nodorum]KAH3973803.1 hypothetical protein HBH52_138870 [Parastagonospora nodorum]
MLILCTTTTIVGNSASTTVVVINTPVPTNACLPNTITCDATGLDVAFYANSVVPEEAYGNSSAVSPDYYLGQNALGTGSTNDLTILRVDIPDNESPTYIETLPYYASVSGTYADIPYNPNNGTFVFSGYFRPPFTGIYSICVEVDSVDNFYLGSDRAFPCGGQGIVADADPTLAVTNFGDSEPACIMQNLVEGFFYPLRSVYGMYGLPSVLLTNITFPGTGANLASPLEGSLFPQSCQTPPTTMIVRSTDPTDVAH